MANLAPFMPVLVLIRRVFHRSMLNFAVAGSTVYRSNTWEKILQGESQAQCSFKRKQAFISLSSFACGKSLKRCGGARTHLRALMRRKSCAVAMRNAILRNHLEHSICHYCLASSAITKDHVLVACRCIHALKFAHAC